MNEFREKYFCITNENGLVNQLFTRPFDFGGRGEKLSILYVIKYQRNIISAIYVRFLTFYQLRSLKCNPYLFQHKNGHVSIGHYPELSIIKRSL